MAHYSTVCDQKGKQNQGHSSVLWKYVSSLYPMKQHLDQVFLIVLAVESFYLITVQTYVFSVE